MEFENEKITPEKIAALQDAEKEQRFSAESLLKDIIPLIDEYFIADLYFDGKSTNLFFFNGQRFRLSVKEL